MKRQKRRIGKMLCIGLLALGTGVFAQNRFKIGLDAGYTYSAMHANLSNLVDSKYTSRYGIGVNLSGEYMVWNMFLFLPEFHFYRKIMSLNVQEAVKAGTQSSIIIT